MRMTNEIRRSIEQQVAQQITINEEPLQKAQQRLQEFANTQTAPRVRELIDDGVTDALHRQGIYISGGFLYIFCNREWQPSDEQKDVIEKILEPVDNAKNQKSNLLRQLRAVLKSCTTVKKAQEALPDIADIIDKVEARYQNLTNNPIATDLSKGLKAVME